MPRSYEAGLDEGAMTRETAPADGRSGHTGSEDASGSAPRADTRPDGGGPGPGDVVELRIDDLAYGGAGVGRVGGLVCFAAGGMPGDRLRVRVRARKPAYAEVDVLEVLEPGAQRTAPPCAHFGACGGCQWMSLEYQSQLAAKERILSDALDRIGRLQGVTLHPIAPSPETLGYRNRMEFSFREGPRGLYAGLHRGDDPSVVEEILRCHLQDDEANRILGWTVAACREMGLRSDTMPPSERGGLRRLLIRKRSDGRFLVALVTGEGAFPEARVLAERMREAFPAIEGVVRWSGRSEGSEGRVVPLSGEALIREAVDGLSLTVAMNAFQQVNPAQARRLYARVRELAAVSPQESVLDLYCGAGVLTLLLGRAGRAATGVETSAAAVRCAERNARENGLERCRFVLGDARRVCLALRARGERYDLVVMNPPRAGLQKETARAAAALGARCLVYVSCNPATLARDLARFRELGYRTTDAAPFDMFPQTYHVETVARLERG